MGSRAAAQPPAQLLLMELADEEEGVFGPVEKKPACTAMLLRRLRVVSRAVRPVAPRVRRLSEEASGSKGAALHARALEALDWGAPKEAVLHLLEEASGEGHAASGAAAP